MYIIDRTKNPQGKHLPNTERFLNRVRSQIKTSIADLLKKAKIEEALRGVDNQIRVTGSILHEPSIHIDRAISDWTLVLPGNPKGEAGPLEFRPPGQRKLNSLINCYIEKDEIEKPSGGGAGCQQGSPDGEGSDDFIFTLDKKEWEKFLLDELALPNQDDRKSILVMPEWRKAGYASDGSPANLALKRTFMNSFGRKISFGRPTEEEIAALMELANAATTEEELQNLLLLIEEKKARMAVIPWIDPIDVRYHSYKKEMRPKFNAVMFALMDVSGSMTEHMKDLAKRFYILLYSFLKARYERVEIVFIRHTHVAAEVDEQTFFYDPETGGTVVSTALQLMNDIIKDRFPLSDWNIYGAQCSDGDNTSSDNELVVKIMGYLLPIVQHFVYVEVGRDSQHFPVGFIRRESDLWTCYKEIKETYGNVFDMDKVGDKSGIWPLMLKFYHKDKANG